MSRAIDIAWAAGLFEGEGNLYLQKTRPGPPQPQMSLSMTDPDVVQRFRDIVNCGNIRIHEDQKHPHFKRQYRWRLCSWERVSEVVDLFKPYLGERRLEHVKVFEAARDEPRYGHRPKMKCKRGHPMTEANTLIVNQANNNGVHRKCRQCGRERKKEEYWRKKEAVHGP
ncbi:MAG: hypothetical protein FVQ81_18400 [Candidatus Glassbacteria bacterium]|nr:hypothetical protein [Candidatus Glassbacteria bacterium]